MNLTIRPARPEDAAALLDYLRQIGGESDNLTFGAEGLPATLEEEEAFLRGQAAQSRSVMLQAWGQGVGTAIMERLVAHARDHGVEIIELQVRSDNTRAIRLYEKFGFVKIGRYPGFLKVNGVNVDCDLMNLYL